MLKKTKKRILYVLFIMLLIGILTGVIINSLGVIVSGRCAEYVNDYNEYYLYKKNILIKGFLGGGNGYKIWFAPGQKEKLLGEIKEEIIIELENLKANNSDILRNYEISNDFKNIIYYYKGAIEGIYKLEESDLIRIETKVELYHQFIVGYGRTEFPSSQILDFVEVK